MPATRRKRYLAIALLALAVIACTCSMTDLLEQIQVPAAVTQPESETIPLATTEMDTADPADSDPTAQPEDQTAATVPPEIARQMDEIESQVAKLRGIPSSGPVARALLTPEQLRQRVLDDFFADYTQEEATNDTRTLHLFGLLEADFDLYELYIELYSEGIAGFYDDEEKEMFVVTGAGFGGAERLTYAHEFTHALQDQRYDLSEGLGYNDEQCELDSERCAGVQSLVEGDATLLEQQWFLNYATEQDWLDLQEFMDSYESPVFDSAPMFLQEDFLFPYEYGLDFVNELHLQGGWAAVDAAYAEPPRSTEQILHPERYPDDRPVWLQVPDLAPALGNGWEQIDQDVLGEWYTLLVLEEYLFGEDVSAAAEGWGGDYYLALYNETLGLGALVLLTQWDTVPDAHEFLETFFEYGDWRFYDRVEASTTRAAWEWELGYSTIELQGNQTLWVLAPDREAALLLREAIAFPAPLGQPPG